MIRTYFASSNPPAPYRPGGTLPVGPADLGDPGGQRFVAAWLGHVAAGRIGGHLCGPTAALREARRPPANAEARAIVLANERLICGDGRLGIW